MRPVSLEKPIFIQPDPCTGRSIAPMGGPIGANDGPMQLCDGLFHASLHSSVRLALCWSGQQLCAALQSAQVYVGLFLASLHSSVCLALCWCTLNRSVHPGLHSICVGLVNSSLCSLIVCAGLCWSVARKFAQLGPPIYACWCSPHRSGPLGHCKAESVLVWSTALCSLITFSKSQLL